MEETKSSSEWWYEHPMWETHSIADPDGWDRQNLHYSFYQEKITFAQFEERLLKSTLIPKFKIDPV